MDKFTTISAKISKEEREEIKKLKLNPTEIIRKAVQEEIRRARDEELVKKMMKVRPIILKLKMDEIISDIREDRDRSTTHDRSRGLVP
ncbi:MAG: CopG family transcriptional regulator [Thermoplasmataceae archaeon]